MGALKKLKGQHRIGAIVLMTLLIGFFSGYFSHSHGLRLGLRPAISDVTVMNVTPTTAIITFMTDRPTAGYVHYATTSDLSVTSNIGGLYVRPLHHIDLSGLVPGTTYHYYVTADAGGFSTASKNGSFTTKSSVKK